MTTPLASFGNLFAVKSVSLLALLIVLLFYSRRLPGIVRSIRSLPKAFREGKNPDANDAVDSTTKKVKFVDKD